VTALRGVDLTLRRGTLTALVGANGSGKTTLLRILAGIVAPRAGEVEVLGVPRPARSRPSTLRALRRRVSYLSQGPALDPELTGAEILALMATLHGVPRRERKGRVAELADAFGVTGHLGSAFDHAVRAEGGPRPAGGAADPAAFPALYPRRAPAGAANSGTLSAPR
jgi:ABC-type multidrug transport system ATPase subunit